MQKKKRIPWWHWPVILYLLIMVGFPVYYLQEDYDWNYASWGTPHKIVKSCRRYDNPIHGDEGVYARVFVFLPSQQNREKLNDWNGKQELDDYQKKLLTELGLPGPYRSGWLIEYGIVDFVECGNGLWLLTDLSRNKGGLFSDRMPPPNDGTPAHMLFFYYWGFAGAVAGVLFIPLLILCGGMAFVVNIVRGILKDAKRCR